MDAKFCHPEAKNSKFLKCFKIIRNNVEHVHNIKTTLFGWVLMILDDQNIKKIKNSKINTENAEIWRLQCRKQYAFALQVVLRAIPVRMTFVSSKSVGCSLRTRDSKISHLILCSCSHWCCCCCAGRMAVAPGAVATAAATAPTGVLAGSTWSCGSCCCCSCCCCCCCCDCCDCCCFWLCFFVWFRSVSLWCSFLCFNFSFSKSCR